MSKKRLIILTATFPYGKSEESFLVEEVKFLQNYFEILILPLRKKEGLRELKNINHEDYINNCDRFGKYKYFFLHLLFRVEFYVGIVEIYKSGFKLRKIVSLVKVLSRTLAIKNKIERKLSLNIDTDILYSYWLDSTAYAATYFNCKKLSRAHGYDLYKERADNFYHPLKSYYIKKLSKVLCVSSVGKDYVKREYGSEENVVISSLGVKIQPSCIHRQGKVEFISCSRLHPVKRIDLLIDVFSKIKNGNILLWRHIGGGDLLVKLSEMANDQLESLKYDFLGEVTEEEIHKIYSEEKKFIFINVSSSEGVPVSIMEAMSFSIPCIACDVGGVSEIIKNQENGILINKNFSAIELQNAIDLVLVNYDRFSRKAYEFVDENYNVERNYKSLVNIFQRM